MGFRNTCAFALLFATLLGCGGGGGGSGGVTGLSVPNQVTLVDAKGTGSLKMRLGSQLKKKGRRTAEAGTDYDNDQTRFWVHDNSMDALNTVNMILCSIKQTSYDHPSVLNQGPYIALVACEERGKDGGGQGRGGDAPQYERFVVDSKRASPASPHVVDFWIEEQNGAGGQNQPMTLYGRLTITESPSVLLPYGNFTMHFKELLTSQSHDDQNVVFHGFLRTLPRNDGQAEFEFSVIQGDIDGPIGPGFEAFRMRARLIASPDGTSGRAYAENKMAFNNGGGKQTQGAIYHLQYNSDYVAQKKVDGGETIIVLDRNNFTTNVYRYGVYNADSGARIQGNSGFGLETLSGAHGWAGYHGLWFPDHVTITNNQQLVRRFYDGTTPNQNYTAVIVPGRLDKRTREAITLANVRNEDLEYFANSTGEQLLVQWTGSDLVKVATRSNNAWNRLQNPTSMAGSFSADDWVSLYSRHRGNVEFTWPNGGPSDSTPCYVWSHSTITANSPELSGGTLTLHAYNRMLRTNISESQANFNAATPFFPDANTVNDGKQYVFTASTMMLTQSGDPVDLATGVTITSGPGLNGLYSGPMFTSPLADLGDIGSRTTQYSWSIGPNEWNKLRTVKDTNGQIVAFTAPQRLNYTHTQSGNEYDGKSFVLEWTGTELHGVPFTQNESDGRWYPGFNIASATTIVSGDTTYKVKQLEGEQKMVAVGNPNQVITAQGFDLSVILTAPGNNYQDPGIGPMPALSVAPKFVGGELQGN